MEGRFLIYIIPVVLGLVISSIVAAVAWQRQRMPGAKALVLISALAVIWSIAKFLELNSMQLESSVLWMNVGYLSAVMIPIAWLIFALGYCGYQHLITRNNILLLFVIPIITIGLTLTNGLHHFIWREISLGLVEDWLRLGLINGPWFYVNFAFSGVVFVVCGLLFFRKAGLSPHFDISQVGVIRFVAVVPILGVLLDFPGWNTTAPLDLMVFSVIVSMIAFVANFFSFSQPDDTYHKAFEGMNDGVLILDHADMVLDINHSAESLFGVSKEDFLGLPITEVFSRWFGELAKGIDLAKTRQEIELDSADGKIRWMTISINKIGGVLNRDSSKVIVLQDSSTHKQMTLNLQNHQKYISGLNEVTKISVSSTEFGNALQDLANQIGVMFHADGCLITRWDEVEKREFPLVASGVFKKSYKLIQPTDGAALFIHGLITNRKLVAVEDLQNSNYLSPESANRYPTKSFLAVPLEIMSELIGGLIVGFNQPRQFSDREIATAEIVSKQIALVVSRMARADLADKRAAELDALRKVIAIISAELSQDDTFDQILAQLEKLVKFDAGYIQLQKGITLEVVGGRGKNVSEKTLSSRLPLTGDGPATRVFRSRQPVMIGNVHDQAIEISQPFPEWVSSWMGVPLIIANKVIGLLTLEGSEQDQFSDSQLRISSAFADYLAISVRNQQLTEEIQSLLERDDLTGLYNRDQLIQHGDLELLRARRYWHPLSVILVDVDNFKQINESFGHAIGDEVLRSLANTCMSRIREVDIMGRYGGEEFVIILPETSSEMAYETAERLRTCANDNPVLTKAGPVNFTISAGVAEFNLKMGGLSTLIDRAEFALKKAKDGGRNRVYCHGSPAGLPKKN